MKMFFLYWHSVGSIKIERKLQKVQRFPRYTSTLTISQ